MPTLGPNPAPDIRAGWIGFRPGMLPPKTIMKAHTRSSMFLGLFAVMALAPVHASSVSISGSAPTSNLLLANTAQTPAATIWLKNDAAANQWGGDLFYVSGAATTIDKITLQYASFGSAVTGAAMTLSLFQVDAAGSTFSNTITGRTNLQTDHFTLPGSMASTGFLTFDLTDTTLQPSSVAYGFVLSFDATASGRSFAFTRGNTDGASSTLAIDTIITGSFRSSLGDSSYSKFGTSNLHQLFIEGTVSSIPEPASWAALLGGAVLGAAMFFRRRGRR